MKVQKYWLVGYVLLALLLLPYVALATHLLSHGGVTGTAVGRVGIVFLMGFAGFIARMIVRMRG